MTKHKTYCEVVGAVLTSDFLAWLFSLKPNELSKLFARCSRLNEWARYRPWSSEDELAEAVHDVTRNVGMYAKSKKTALSYTVGCAKQKSAERQADGHAALLSDWKSVVDRINKGQLGD